MRSRDAPMINTQPPEPLLRFEPHRHADHFAHVAYTLLRPELDRRRASLLSFWLQPQAGTPVQASLDRHLISDPRPADVPDLDSWLGAHDPVNSPSICGSTMLSPLRCRTNRFDRSSHRQWASG